MMTFPLPHRLNCILAFIAGCLCALCYSPIDFWWLGPFAIAALYLSLHAANPRQAGWTGLCFGIGYFGVGVSWVFVSINVYTGVGIAGAGLITMLFVMVLSLFLLLQCRLFALCSATRARIAVFAALWVLQEWLRGWLFTGFPWLYLGSAHVTTPLSGIAPLFGVLGLSFVVALTGALLAELLLTLSQRKYTLLLRQVALLVLFLALGMASNQLRWTEPRENETLRIGIVQGNIEQSLKFRADELQDSIDTYDILSAGLWENDLLLWPETAIPMALNDAQLVLDYFTAQANDTGAALATGIFVYDEDGPHNSLAVIGNGSGIWNKQKLVPFGEYVPLRAILSNLLQIFELPMSSLTPGRPGQALLQIGNWQAAAFICYEVVYPDFVRRYGREADFLLTVSNDTWFGASWGPWQHLQIAAMRARELSRPMLRATNNGISALISEQGVVTAQTQQFVQTTLQGEIQLYQGQTPFSLWGSWPVLLLSSLILLLNILSMRSKLSAKRTDSAQP